MINIHERMLPDPAMIGPGDDRTCDLLITSRTCIRLSHRGPLDWVEVKRPSEPIKVMSSVVSLHNHTFSGHDYSSKRLTSRQYFEIFLKIGKKKMCMRCQILLTWVGGGAAGEGGGAEGSMEGEYHKFVMSRISTDIDESYWRWSSRNVMVEVNDVEVLVMSRQ